MVYNDLVKIRNGLYTVLVAGLFILFLPTQIYSQPASFTDSMLKSELVKTVSPTLDSLSLLLDKTENESKRLEVLHAICDESVNTNADRCIKYGLEGLQLAEKLNDLSKQRSISTCLGISYDDKGEYSKAVEMYERVLSVLAEEQKNQIDTTVDLYVREAYTLNNLGYVYFNLGEYNKALEFYYKGLEVADKNAPTSRATILGSMGELYLKIGDLAKTEEIAREALRCAGDEFDLIVTCRMMGDLFEKQNMPDSSLYYYEKAFQSAVPLKDNYLVGMSIEGLVEYYLARRDFAKVISIAQTGLAVAEELNGKVLIISTHLALAEAYGQTGQLQRARTHAEKALALSQSSNTISMLPQCYSMLESCNIMDGNFEKAYEYVKLHQSALENIFNNEKGRIITEAENKYLLQQKENENQLLKAQQAKNEALLWRRNAINVAAVIFLIFTLTVVFFLYKNIRHKKLYNQKLKNDVAVRTAELQSANIELERFNHIVSHDLKEPLRNIISFAGLGLRKTKNIDDQDLKEYLVYIKNASTQLNKLIEDIRDFTRLGKEMPKLKPVDLNNILNRVVDHLNIKIQEKNAVINYGELPTIESHPSLLFVLYKNLIENGIKYNKHSQPSVKLDYEENSQTHIFKIKDNGIGIPKEHKEDVFKMFKRLHNRREYMGSGMGLSICKKIVDKLDGEISIFESSEEGTTFKIAFPKR
ncbi:MAG: tetratricopeptide repeat protein [Bacteroidota bacterium]